MAACEPLEARRLFAVELLSGAAPGPFLSTGNGNSPAPNDLMVGIAPSSPVSDDGRFVVFTSEATNLLSAGPTRAGDVNVFIRDRLNLGSTGLISAPSQNLPRSEEGYSGTPVISGDGSYVAYASTRTDLVAGDTNHAQDVFVFDRQRGVTLLADHTPAGAAGNAGAADHSLSQNGRYVLFTSESTDLVPGFGRSFENALYRYDIYTSLVEPVTDVLAAQVPSAHVLGGAISDDGNVVAFGTAGGLGSRADVYVRDMTSGVQTLVSLDTEGRPVDAPEFELSGDGTRVVFITAYDASHGDTNGAYDVYVRDLQAGTTTCASVGADGKTGRAFDTGSDISGFGGRSISNHGRYVVFQGLDDLAGIDDAEAGDPLNDVYLRDLATNTTTLLSADQPGGPSASAILPTISADGYYAAYLNDPGPSGAASVVVVNLLTGERTIANRGIGGAPVDPGLSALAGEAFSRQGNVMVFASDARASDLVPGSFIVDGDATSDLFALPLAGDPNGDFQPPGAGFVVGPALTAPGTAFVDIDAHFIDNVGIDVSTLGSVKLIITGPNDFRQEATPFSIEPNPDAKHVIVHYHFLPPGGGAAFTADDNGSYPLLLEAANVKDLAGNRVGTNPELPGGWGINVTPADAPDFVAMAPYSPFGQLLPLLAGGPGTRQKIQPMNFAVRNGGNRPAVGTVDVRLVASTDETFDAGDAVVAELRGQKINLAPGKIKTFRFKIKQLPLLDGLYHLMGVVDPDGKVEEQLNTNNAAAMPLPTFIKPPFVDLSVGLVTLGGGRGALHAGKKATLQFLLTNAGNVDARGTVPLRVRLKPAGDPAGAAAREWVVPIKVKAKPLSDNPLRVKVTLPRDVVAGSYLVEIELPADNPLTGPPGDARDGATSEAPMIVA